MKNPSHDIFRQNENFLNELDFAESLSFIQMKTVNLGSCSRPDLDQEHGVGIKFKWLEVKKVGNGETAFL